MSSDAAPTPDAPPTPRELLRRVRLRVLHGDRPYLLALGAAVAMAVVVVSGPVQTWLEQRDLVEQADGTLAALEAENDRLATRVAELNDPGTIEAEAREEQGMVRPGEVPYVVVPPLVDSEQIAPDLTDIATDDRGLLARLWDGLTEFFSR